MINILLIVQAIVFFATCTFILFQNLYYSNTHFQFASIKSDWQRIPLQEK